jgi:hypothetical protein
VAYYGKPLLVFHPTNFFENMVRRPELPSVTVTYQHSMQPYVEASHVELDQVADREPFTLPFNVAVRET